MKNLIYVSFFILSLQNLPKAQASFDTANGQYLSEQDLYLVLKSLFLKPGLLTDVDYDLSYLGGSTPLYELGFINLETGQPMTQSPGESYVLYIDIFLNRALNLIAGQNPYAFYEKMFSSELKDDFKKKYNEHISQTGKYIPFMQYIDQIKFSSLSQEQQNAFVLDLLRLVFQEDALIPSPLKASLLNSLVPLMISRDFSVKVALFTTIKKSIINDYFLKY